MRNIFITLLLGLTFFAGDVFASRSIGVGKQYARIVYDVGATNGNSTAHGLGVKLPANAVITDLWVYINTAFESSGTSRLALQCAGTRDLMEYVNISAGDEDKVYVARRAEATFNFDSTGIIPADTEPQVAGSGSVASECEVTAVVRGDSGDTPFTAGKATVLLEYFRQ